MWHAPRTGTRPVRHLRPDQNLLRSVIIFAMLLGLWLVWAPVIPVGIAYGSGTKKARNILLQVAKDSPLALDHPKPQAIFRQFGESSLDFELRVFIPDRDRWLKLINEMHMNIDQAFRAAKIEIAFPQRDIHVRSISDILPIRQDHPGSAPASSSLDSKPGYPPPTYPIYLLTFYF